MKKLLLAIPILIIFGCVPTLPTANAKCSYLQVVKGKFGHYALTKDCYKEKGYQITAIFLPKDLKKAATEGALLLHKWFPNSKVRTETLTYGAKTLKGKLYYVVVLRLKLT